MAAGIGGDGSADVIGGIRDNTRATVAGIQGAAEQELNRLDELERRVGAVLDQMRGELAPGIEQMTTAAADQARAMGRGMAEHISEAEAGCIEGLDQSMTQAVEQLSQVPAGDDVSADAAEEYASGVAAELAAAAGDAVASLDEPGAQLGAALDELQTRFTAGVDDTARGLESRLGELDGQVQDSAGRR